MVAYLAAGASGSTCFGLATVRRGQRRRRRKLEHAVDRFGEPRHARRSNDDADHATIRVDERATARTGWIGMVQHQQRIGADALLPTDQARADPLAQNPRRVAPHVPSAEALADG